MKWVIGCGVLFLIGAGLLVGAGFLAFREVEKIGEAGQEASAKLEAVKEAHPFAIPEDRLLDPGRVDVYLDARQQIATWVTGATEKTEEGSFFSKLGSVVGAFREAPSAAADILAHVGMSAGEYAWISQEINYVIRYSYRTEVLAEFPAMAELQQSRETQGDESAEFQLENDGATFRGWRAVSSIDPFHLTVPRPNVETVAARVADFVSSMGASTVEDLYLSNFHPPLP